MQAVQYARLTVTKSRPFARKPHAQGGGSQADAGPSPAYKRNLDVLKEDINTLLIGFPGSFIEDKGLTLSVHYRLVNQDQMDLTVAQVWMVLMEFQVFLVQMVHLVYQVLMVLTVRQGLTETTVTQV